MRRPWLKFQVALYLLQKFDELIFLEIYGGESSYWELENTSRESQQEGDRRKR